MDQNGDNNGDNNNDADAFDFGIHLDDLAETDDLTETGDAAAPQTGRSHDPDASGPPGAGQRDPAAETDRTSDDLLESIQEIRTELSGLAQDFDTKLKYDAHKNKVIDELHQSLQDYRDGLLKKYLKRIITDVIKIVDDVRKLTGHYREQPFSEENNAKLIQYLEDIAHDLEDTFAWEGVVSFNTESDLLDPVRQRVVNKIGTADAAKDKMIAERLRPGYEWDGKVIRPEIVSIYIYNNESSAENKEI